MDIKKKILIIEDEQSLLEVLEKKLEKEGFEVFTAVDGINGLKQIREIHPDLVLLDILMPRKDGFEVLEELNQDEILCKIPVIIISNSGQPVEIDRALKLGVKDYLVKANFDPENVIEKVNNFLKEENNLQKNNKKMIVLIEDDVFLRDLCVRKLKKENFEVVSAENGEEGLKKIKECEPDLVLLDIILPGIGGFEVLKQIKEDEKTQHIPVIMLTNLGEKEDIEKGLILGAADYLVKAHFSPDEIVERIYKVLKKQINY